MTRIGHADAAAWAAERRLWLEGAEGHRALMDPACVMAFPGVGVMRGDAILAALEAAQPWVSVTIADATLARHGEDCVVLAYRAEGRRADDAPWRALCTSVWRRGPHGWRLIQHQQGPA